MADIDFAVAPVNGQVLKYNSTTLKWSPANDNSAAAGIALTDLSASAPLAYNNTTGAFSLPAANVLSLPLTSLASGTGAITASDSILGAFGKLMSLPSDYVSRSSGASIVTGTIAVSGTGMITVPTASGTTLTEVANVTYVNNMIAANGVWNKSGSDINYTAGKVGIGTGSPTAPLSIGPNPVAVFNSGELLQLGRSSDAYMTISDGTGRFLLGTTSGLPFIGTQNATDFVLRTNNIEKVRISSSGNVGVGTASPTAKLDVAGQLRVGGTSPTLTNYMSMIVGQRPANDNFSTIRFGSSTGARGWSLDAFDDSTTAQYFQIYDQTNSAARLTIANSGNVGIGTATPQNILDIVGNSLAIRNSVGANGTGYGLEFSTSFSAPRVDFVANGNYVGQFSSDSTSVFFKNNLNNTGDLRFTTKAGGVEGTKLYISNAGNVGIGTTAPSFPLHVVKTSSVSNTSAASLDVTNSVASTIPGAALNLNYTAPSAYFGTGLSINSSGGYAIGEKIISSNFGSVIEVSPISYAYAVESTVGSIINTQGTGVKVIGTPTYGVSVDSISNTNPVNSFIARRARGGAIGSLGYVQSGDLLGSLSFEAITNITAAYYALPSGYLSGAKINSYSPSGSSSGSATGDLRFHTNSGAGLSERMRIDQTGNVGIGTTNPVVALDVSGDGHFSSSIRVGSNSSAFANRFYAMGTLTAGNGTTFTAANKSEAIYIGNNDSSLQRPFSVYKGSYGAGSVIFGTTGVGIEYNISNAGATKHLVAATDAIMTNTNSGDFIISTENNGSLTEKLRIMSSGNIGIGTTGPGYKLDVVGDMNTSTALRIAGTSICTSAGCTSSSDRTLKENIKPLANSIDNILKLQGVGYDWKDKKKYGDKHQIGLIAQDVEKIYPEVVITDEKTGLKSMAYDHLISPMIEAFKELNKRFTSLVATVINLEEKVALTDSKTAKLESENAALRRKFETETLALKKENQLMKAKLEKIEKLLEKSK